MKRRRVSTDGSPDSDGPRSTDSQPAEFTVKQEQSYGDHADLGFGGSAQAAAGYDLAPYEAASSTAASTAADVAGFLSTVAEQGVCHDSRGGSSGCSMILDANRELPAIVMSSEGHCTQSLYSQTNTMSINFLISLAHMIKFDQ